MQCAFVFAVKNKVIYFQLSIANNIQNLIKQYMHMKSHTLNKALAQDCEKTINPLLDSPKSSFLSLWLCTVSIPSIYKDQLLIHYLKM